MAQYLPNFSIGSDEEDSDEYTEEEIANDPSKRMLWAAENNKVETVQALLQENPKLALVKDSDGYTPLHRSSYNNHVDVAKMILSVHPDGINARTIDGWQPLHSAARWNSVETAQLLISNDADINAKTNGNLTPLHMAASERNNKKMLELLLNDPFIDVNVVSKAGETAAQLCKRTSAHYSLFETTDTNVNKLF